MSAVAHYHELKIFTWYQSSFPKPSKNPCMGSRDFTCGRDFSEGFSGPMLEKNNCGHVIGYCRLLIYFV